MGNCATACQREGYFKDLKFLIGDLTEIDPSEQFLYILAREHLDCNRPPSKNDYDVDYRRAPVCAVFSMEKRLMDYNEDVTRGPAGAHLFEPLTRKRPLFCYQTYVSWKSKTDVLNSIKCLQKKKNVIYVQLLGPFPDFLIQSDIFSYLKQILEPFFWPIEIVFLPEMSLENSNWVIKQREHSKTKRSQLLASSVYSKLSSVLPIDGLCIIGITWTDLYPSEDFNFVLGESSARHKAGVFSFGRFEPKKIERDGLCQDVESVTPEMVWKFLKVATHEICHILVMDHCYFFKCAMNESTSVDEAISQPFNLCPVCLRKLQDACHFNVLDRYRMLRNAVSDIYALYPCDKFRYTIDWMDRCIAYIEDQGELCRELKSSILQQNLAALMKK